MDAKLDTTWSLYHNESNRIVRAVEDSESAMLVAETLGWAIGDMLARISAAHQPQSAMDTGLIFGQMVKRIEHHIVIEKEFEAVGAGFKLEGIGDQVFLPETTEYDRERDRLREAIRAVRPTGCHALIDALGKILAYGTTDADREIIEIKALVAAIRHDTSSGERNTAPALIIVHMTQPIPYCSLASHSLGMTRFVPCSFSFR
jgi:hypothetical protein